MSSNPSILVADDNDEVRKVMRLSLERAGYDVCEAANGLEAMRAVNAIPFDLVITDILMPERDGIETILHLRQKAPQAKILAISGAQDNVFLASASGLGATRTLTKPFTPTQLLNVVSELLVESTTAPRSS
ncbi:MAG: response regulator [Phycisphaerales bacterium]|nr:response regulator [Phycisphaerales bacterium]